LLAVLHHEMPDCVPCCPDISNMVPCRLTGKPFWDIYVYQNPPLWKAHVDALKHFDIDGGFEVYSWGDLFGDQSEEERRIVSRNRDGSFVTQTYCRPTGHCFTATHYVVTNGTPGVSSADPYTNWDTAGTNIIDVVNAAMTNAVPRVVWVSNGVYVLLCPMACVAQACPVV